MVTEITPAELNALRESGAPVYVLDVREAHELAIASIPDVVHIPMGQVPERLGEIPRDRTVHVFCRSGGRSLQVARFLEQQGYQSVANVTGGILRWGQEVDSSIPAY